MTTGAAIEPVALSIDVVTLALKDGQLQVLLMRRADEPFSGLWALPGGITHKGERLSEAANRILQERTGIVSDYLEQLYTFGDPGRDPRGRTVSVTYFTLLPLGDHPTSPGRGATDAAWHVLSDLPTLAFDHDAIVHYARQRLAQKITYAPFAFHVLPEAFTMADLRAVHEAVLGEALHPSNFARQMLGRWDLAPVSGVRDKRTRRPARLYRYIGSELFSGPPQPDILNSSSAVVSGRNVVGRNGQR